MREPEIDLPGLLDLILNALQGVVKETTSEFDRSDFEEQLHNLVPPPHCSDLRPEDVRVVAKQREFADDLPRGGVVDGV